MKILFALLVLALLAVPVLADNVTENVTPTITITPTPIPLVISFQGGHTFGEYPVEFDNSLGDPPVVVNTSSRGIELDPDPDYVVRVEPAGISDVLNSPDSGFFSLGDYAEANPMGVLFIAVLAAVVIMKFRRRGK